VKAIAISLLISLFVSWLIAILILVGDFAQGGWGDGW
jgi:hypothetical protein